MTTAVITTEARRLVREHNELPESYSGTIWKVDLSTGMLMGCVGQYAATQAPLGDRIATRTALLRISHAKLSQAEAQRFIDVFGEGF